MDFVHVDARLEVGNGLIGADIAVKSISFQIVVMYAPNDRFFSSVGAVPCGSGSPRLECRLESQVG